MKRSVKKNSPEAQHGGPRAQTHIRGNVQGPVLSGNFSGPVTIKTGGSGDDHALPPSPGMVRSQATVHSSGLREAAAALIGRFCDRDNATAVDYEDCFCVEPINWLYPERAADGTWREGTWALEVFFKGPHGERGGALFAAVKDDAEATRRLDRIALLSLRKAVLSQLLTKYPSLTFSINVTALTLADDAWFRQYAQEFVESLRKHGAADRVVLEIQEHPAQLLQALGLDGNALSRRLELLRHAPLPMALDDAYSEGYVFQAASDSLNGGIVWQKMDWQYFQEKAVDARSTVRDGIRRCLRQETPTLVVEGVEDDTLKGFLCEDVLGGGRIARRIAIQSRTTQIILAAIRPGNEPVKPSSGKSGKHRTPDGHRNARPESSAGSGGPSATDKPPRDESPEPDDARWCEAAIKEAQKCKSEPGRVSPKVGCVVVRKGRMLKKGYRGELKPGDHAEYTVIDRKLEGVLVDGVTVYTTLEPCTQRSPEKTPCAERLVQARVARVVIGMVDPDPRISGRGIRLLGDAGIQVDLFPKIYAARVEGQNREFVRLQKRREGGAAEARAVTAGNDRTATTTDDSRAAMPARAMLSALHQLPAPPADFVGRETYLQALTAAGAAGAAITGVRGMGGIGKTALALKAATILCERYADAQFFVNLRGSREDPMTPAEALSQVIRGYHPMAQLPEDEVELQALYRTALHGKRALLLFDDARDAEQVKALLPPPTCYILITSRRQFTLPGLKPHDLDILAESEASELVLEIAPRLGEAAGELAGLCGCLPLALRVAASQVTSHPLLDVRECVARLREARARLPEVEASLSLSYDLLPADVQTRWTALAVFPADFDAAAAAAVFTCEEAQAREALDELVGGSLVQWEEKTGRLLLHDLVRSYADSLVEPGLRGRLQERHAEHYLGVLSAAEDLYLKGGDGVNRGLALADREWPNILAGQRWAAGSDDKTAGRMCSRYSNAGAYVLSLRLHPEEQIRWLESALEAARGASDRGAEGRHLGNLGNAYADLGQLQKAIEYYEKQLVITREIGDRRGEGAALGNLGLAYADLGQPQKATEYFEKQLIITREIGDRRREGNALGNLGYAYADLGQPQKAIEYYEKQLIITREIGDRRGEGAYLGNLGYAYADLGQPQKAIEYNEQALAIAREIGDRRGEGIALGNLGSAHADLGQPQKAIEYHEQALVISREIGDRRAEGADLGNLGNAYAALGQPQKAIEYHEKQLVIVREIGDRRGEANACWNMGDELAKAGDPRRAVELMQVCVDFEREIGHPDAQKHAAHVERLRVQLREKK